MEGNKNLWKKPVKQYNPGYPRVEKKLYEQFYEIGRASCRERVFINV